MRSELHRIIALGYVTITPDLQLEVTSRGSMPSGRMLGSITPARSAAALLFARALEETEPGVSRVHNDCKFRT